MSVLEALLLGLIQGITEFLPVSSSGHLAVVEHLWKLPTESRLPLTTMLHGATALAVIFYFAPLLARLIRGLWSRDPARRSSCWQMVGFIVLASLPAGVVGVLFSDVIDRAFSNPLLIGMMLLVTGGVLFSTRFSQPRGRTGWRRVLLVGIGQAIAILPGISRSGATIASGLYLGMERKDAFEFSFLLAIPAIAGAFLLEFRKINLAVLSPSALAAGMVAAFVSGLAALFLLAGSFTGLRSTAGSPVWRRFSSFASRVGGSRCW
jgi:undecaprenyl-diphosphatase